MFDLSLMGMIIGYPATYFHLLQGRYIEMLQVDYISYQLQVMHRSHATSFVR